MINIISKEEMSKLPYIIAVDFDGTLVEDEFPYIGKPRPQVWVDLIQAQRTGAKVVLWTSRDGRQLAEAIDFCTMNGLYFDSINTNISEVQHMFNNDTRKIYANEYWDDKAVAKYSRLRGSIYERISSSV